MRDIEPHEDFLLLEVELEELYLNLSLTASIIPKNVPCRLFNYAN